MNEGPASSAQTPSWHYPVDYPTELVLVLRQGKAMLALVGPDLTRGVGGVGDTCSNALRDLAKRIEESGWQSDALCKTRGLFLVPGSDPHDVGPA